MDNNKFKEITGVFKKSNKIAVFTGAGISTSCGIPDFRGEKGIYSIVKKKYNLPYPEAVFDIEYFKKNPEPFFDLSKAFFNKDIKPSLSHKFIAWLEEKNKITTVVTQNIDMLHQKAGTKNIVECHGTYASAHCLDCSAFYKEEDIEISLKKGLVPYCKCGGIIKPDIIFFGEELPKNFFAIYNNTPEIDLLLVMGTSLNVQPAASFALKLAQNSISIIVNLEKTNFDNYFTYTFHQDLDSFSKIIWENLNEKNN